LKSCPHYSGRLARQGRFASGRRFVRRQSCIGVTRTTALAGPLGRPRAGMLVEETPPQLFFVGSAIFHYLGPSFAVLLFAASIRSESHLCECRPDLCRLAAAMARAACLPSGCPAAGRLVRSCACHDECMFLHRNRPAAPWHRRDDRIPAGDLARRPGRSVAPQPRRTRSRRYWGLRTHRHEARSEPVGVAFAFANALLFAAYIVLAHRLARVQALRGSTIWQRRC
jgi:inner membrane transporter RhtA